MQPALNIQNVDITLHRSVIYPIINVVMLGLGTLLDYFIKNRWAAMPASKSAAGKLISCISINCPKYYYDYFAVIKILCFLGFWVL